jgi:hypothetical protein
LAEAGASAISSSQSSLIIAPDASTQTLLSMLGAGANVIANMQNRKDNNDSNNNNNNNNNNNSNNNDDSTIQAVAAGPRYDETVPHAAQVANPADNDYAIFKREKEAFIKKQKEKKQAAPANKGE